MSFLYFSWAVRLGDFDLDSQNDDDFLQIVNVTEIIIHDEYVEPMKYYDLAIIKTETIAMNEHVNKVCLPDKPLSKCGDLNKYKDDVVTLTGYGAWSRSEINSDLTLGRVHLSVYEQG